MEELSGALFLDQVPESWAVRAYASTLGLTSWYADLLLRMKELETWVGDFQVTPVVLWPKTFQHVLFNSFCIADISKILFLQ